MAAKNLMGKSRKPGNPYIVTEDPRLRGWRWEVLKTWQADGTKPYARAFCEVSSPFTQGGSDLGDVYVTEVGHIIVDYDRETFDSAAEAGRALFGPGVPFATKVHDLVIWTSSVG